MSDNPQEKKGTSGRFVFITVHILAMGLCILGLRELPFDSEHVSGFEILLVFITVYLSGLLLLIYILYAENFVVSLARHLKNS
jgi:hypothetical protein